jgi:hypothetical protein
MSKKPHGFVEREPNRDVRSSFSRPVLGGLDDCRNLVSSYGGIHRVSEDFKISPDLLNRYLSGQIDPPYTFLLALYWQSNYGFQQAFAESHWSHQYNSFRAFQAEEKVKSLERLLDHAVRLLEHRPDAAALLRDSIDAVRSSPSKPVPLPVAV